MKKLKGIILLFILFSFYSVQAKEITVDEFQNEYELERTYAVDNFLFDLSNGFNPSLKDLLVASSYHPKEHAKVYEIKIAKNIDDEVVHEYRELIKNQELNDFPVMDIKYIYQGSISSGDFLTIDPDMVLQYGKGNAKVLTKEEYEALGIDHCYVIGDYLFDLDDGFNPSLEDLLIAAATTYTNDIKIYELKKSENIAGDIVVEYNELLSNQRLEEFPLIKVKYVYEESIPQNDPSIVLPYYDVVRLEDVTKTYTASRIVVDEAISENHLPIRYEFYPNVDCSGDILPDGVISVGEYGVLAKSVGTEDYLEGSVCAKLTVVPKDITGRNVVSLIDDRNIYTGSQLEPDFVVVENNIVLEKGVDYTYEYQNNVHVGDASILIQFIGNYTGSRNYIFSIQKKNLSLYAGDYQKVYDDILFETNDLSYCHISNGSSLGEGDSITACHVKADSKLAGNHHTFIESIEITKDGVVVNNDYNITLVQGTMTTTQRSILCTINPKSKTYDGTKLNMNVECTNLVDGHVGASTKTLPTLINVQDSTIFSLERTEIKVTRGNDVVTNNYSIEVSNGGLIPLAILGKDGTNNNRIIITIDPDHVVGDGTPKTPRIVSIYDQDLNVYLQENESYTYTYFNNVNPGTGEIRIQFTGNYKGNRTVTFVIE